MQTKPLIVALALAFALLTTGLLWAKGAEGAAKGPKGGACTMQGMHGDAAKPMAEGMGCGMMGEFGEGLQLTEAQQAQIAPIREKAMAAMKEHRAARMAKEQAIQEALQAQTPDLAAIKTLIAESAAEMTACRVACVEARLAMKGVLTPEQYAKLPACGMLKGEGMMGGCGMMKGGMQGGCGMMKGDAKQGGCCAQGDKPATCGKADCTCGCADGKPCTCAAAKDAGCCKQGDKPATCGKADCTCGCADGKPCTCAAAKDAGCCKQGDKPATCGKADCTCGCADGKPCTCAAAKDAGCGMMKGGCGMKGHGNAKPEAGCDAASGTCAMPE